MPTSAITTILRPLAAYYADPTTIEMRITRPGVVVVDRRGQGKMALDAPDLTLACLEDISKALANFTGVRFCADTSPKLSCIIPDARHRFECLLGASVQTGVSLAIRCKHPFTPRWEDIGASGAIIGYLKDAVRRERNILVSGATNTGKTTLLNMLLNFIEPDRRVIAGEDTPELNIDRFWDGVGLIAAREAGTGAGMVTWRELYDHKMRITPDHVIFGEISTQNAFPALAILNSGVTGFMCTLHAATPQQALTRKFDQNIAWSGQSMPRVPEFLSELIDVVVQIKRDRDGFRRISDIYEPRNDRWVVKDGKLQDPLHEDPTNDDGDVPSPLVPGLTTGGVA